MNINRRSGLSYSIVVLVLMLVAGIATAQSSATVDRITFRGTVGQSRIGMTLLVDGAGAVTGGYYFYASDLKDILLKAGTQGSGIILFAPEGGQFALRFKGNGSEGGKPLDFHNSVGMEGRWMKGDSSYPVTLQMEQVSRTTANRRWYDSVTSESDADFEAKVHNFYNAVLNRDHAAAARFVDYPLRVNYNGKSRIIRSAAELSAHWSQIFTPACVDAFRDAMPHDMFVHNGHAMLGNGVAWFGPKGAQSINVP